MSELREVQEALTRAEALATELAQRRAVLVRARKRQGVTHEKIAEEMGNPNLRAMINRMARSFPDAERQMRDDHLRAILAGRAPDERMDR